jgi:Uma2 family endonuclease
MSTMAAIPPRIEGRMESAPTGRMDVTPEELLAMPDGEHYELVDGVPVERTMSLLSSRVEITLGRILDAHCVEKDLGWVFGPTCGYQCFPWKPGKVRRPDVSFIARDRLPTQDRWSEGYVIIPPDLAVEITSPTDEVYELEEKVEEYLRAGVRLIWVIHPEIRVVQVIRADRSGLRIASGGELSGEDVVPGFRCPVDALFPEARPAEVGDTSLGPPASGGGSGTT